MDFPKPVSNNEAGEGLPYAPVDFPKPVSNNEAGEGLPYAPVDFPKPVSNNEAGEGLPYAPVNFPKPGDIWVWKVGRRISTDGFMLDKYLYPPKRFKMSSHFKRLVSKKQVEDFIKTVCPNANLDDFWSSFHWRIPAKDHRRGEGDGLPYTPMDFPKPVSANEAGDGLPYTPMDFPKPVSTNEAGEDLPYAPVDSPKPVSNNEAGEGLPYAPVNFPKPGDIWVWKVGRRISTDGFMLDKYLYPPKRFKMSSHFKRLVSKKQVEDFIKTVCPNANLDDFWSSFHWRIPAKDHRRGEGDGLPYTPMDFPKPVSTNEAGEDLPYAPVDFPKPVSNNETGEGLPYAPVNFPKPGDIWVWKVGRRISTDGFMLDKYLYPPKRFKMSSHFKRLVSKKQVEDFIKTVCPNANLDDFWSSFHWRIPAKDHRRGEGDGLPYTPMDFPKPVSANEAGDGLPYTPMDFPKPVSTNEAGEDLPYAPVGFPKLVSNNEAGEGLPYAPVNFPKPGDIWIWKVGQRISTDGFMLDRYLYPPKRFKMSFQKRFVSKKQVEDFIKTVCPNSNLDDFWSSFIWRIPAKDRKAGKVNTGEKSHLGNKGHLVDDPILSEYDNEAAVREGREEETPLKRKREEMEIKNVEKDIRQIIKRFPDDVRVAGDDDCCSPCLDFETTPLNKRVIKTKDLVSVAITFDMVKKEKHKSREWFTVEEGVNKTWISYADVDGLNPRNWVTGNIIDWYGTKLREVLKRKTAGGHHQQFVICNNFFYTILAADYKKHMEKVDDEEEYRDMNFHNQTAVLGSKLNRNWTSQISAGNVQSSILIPINYRGNHWALFVVHPLKFTIVLYDPLYKANEALKNYDEEMNALITMLSMYYIHKDPTSNIEWAMNVYSDLPKQPNHYDCGVFVIAYMDCICREVEIKFDEQKGSEYFRYILARDLLEDGGKLVIQNTQNPCVHRI